MWFIVGSVEWKQIFTDGVMSNICEIQLLFYNIIKFKRSCLKNALVEK